MTRIPFIFTSTKRLAALGVNLSPGDLREWATPIQSALPEPPPDDNPGFWERVYRSTGMPDAYAGTRDASLDILRSVGVLGADTEERPELTDEQIKANRAALAEFGSDEDRKTFISMMINPSSMQFSQNKRIVAKPTRNGTAFLHFTDSRGKNNDVLSILFTGVTGNINSNNPELTPENVMRLHLWRDLIALAHEPMIFYDTDLTGKPVPRENKIMVVATTKTFPSGITLIGHFAMVPTFTESAEQPNMMNYSFTLVVHQAYPEVEDLSEIATLFRGDAPPPEMNMLNRGLGDTRLA